MTPTNPGNLVSELLDSATIADPITDVDAGAMEGIAVWGGLSSINGNGTWEYNVGSGWTSAGTVSLESTLLLRSTDSLRFVPPMGGKTAM